MSIAVQKLLNSFENLSESEKWEMALEILQRTIGFDFSALTDEELCLSAEELFLELGKSRDLYPIEKCTEADNYEITTREKTPLAKTVRTSRQLLKVEPAMWLFVTIPGVEPTNNAAERAIRPAVRVATYQFWFSNSGWQYFCCQNIDGSYNSEVRAAQRSRIFDTICCCCSFGQTSPSFAPVRIRSFC